MSEQLSIDMPAGLPSAFIDRWRELGFPTIAGDSCVKAYGRVYFVVRTIVGAFAFHADNAVDEAKCADELAALVKERQGRAHVPPATAPNIAGFDLPTGVPMWVGVMRSRPR